MFNRFERLDRGLTFTSDQERAARSIIESLKTAPGQRKLIILSGLSGVGKTTVLESMDEEILQNGGQTVDPRDIIYSHSRPEAYKGHLITTSTVGEFGEELVSVARKKYPGMNIEVHILPGMDEHETADYLSMFPGGNQRLSPKQIVRNSLGIPLLVHQLKTVNSEHTAARVCANYVARSFRGFRTAEEMQQAKRQYLKMGIPDDVLTIVKELSESFLPEHIYDDLYLALKKMNELRKRGIAEESPLFVASDSERVYDKMLQSRGIASIDIFVPQLNSADLGRIQQAFGFDEYKYRQDIATRAEMFPVEYRKVSFWHRDARGKVIANENEFNYLKSQVLNYVKAFKKGDLGVLETASGGSASFFIHAHAHQGETNPAIVGWMVESLLQQRGIAYFVNNDMYGASYVYQPNQKRIEIFPRQIEIDRW